MKRSFSERKPDESWILSCLKNLQDKSGLLLRWSKQPICLLHTRILSGIVEDVSSWGFKTFCYQSVLQWDDWSLQHSLHSCWYTLFRNSYIISGDHGICHYSKRITFLGSQTERIPDRNGKTATGQLCFDRQLSHQTDPLTSDTWAELTQNSEDLV